MMPRRTSRGQPLRRFMPGPAFAIWSILTLAGAGLLVASFLDSGPITENWRLLVGVALFLAGDAMLVWYLFRNRQLLVDRGADVHNGRGEPE